MVIDLPYTPPYAWDPIRSFLAARAIPGVESVEGDRYGRTFEVDGRQGTVEVRPAPDHPALLAVVRTCEPEDAPAGTLVDEVGRRLRRVFDLDADVAPIEAHLAQSPLLSPLIAAHPGLRVPGAWDTFELGIRAILGQQITVVGARQLAGKLAARYGRPVGVASPGGPLTTVFPEPARMATADLTGFGVPGARARALVAIARATVEDPGLFDRGAPLEAAVQRLRALPGIGEWTAHYIVLRALGQRDAFPAADVGLLRAATGRDGRRPSPQELLAQAEAWRPWRAYAAQHLWTSLVDAP